MIISSIFIFFFKQKTAYELRISDWSSDVCSSDLWDRQGIKSAATYALIHALRRDGVPIEVVTDQDEHQVENTKYMLEWQSRLLQWFDFFIQGKGTTPVPAMTSPFDYQDELREIQDKDIDNRN